MPRLLNRSLPSARSLTSSHPLLDTRPLRQRPSPIKIPHKNKLHTKQHIVSAALTESPTKYLFPFQLIFQPIQVLTDIYSKALYSECPKSASGNLRRSR